MSSSPSSLFRSMSSLGGQGLWKTTESLEASWHILVRILLFAMQVKWSNLNNRRNQGRLPQPPGKRKHDRQPQAETHIAAGPVGLHTPSRQPLSPSVIDIFLGFNTNAFPPPKRFHLRPNLPLIIKNEKLSLERNIGGNSKQA